MAVATSLPSETEEAKSEQVEIVKTVIDLPSIPVQTMISTGQVQTSVNGIIVQNGLATNQVCFNSFQLITKFNIYYCCQLIFNKSLN